MVKVRQLGTLAISQAILWLWFNNKQKTLIAGLWLNANSSLLHKGQKYCSSTTRPLHSYLPPRYIQGTLLCVVVWKIGTGGAEINMEVLLTIGFSQTLQLYGSAILKCWTTLLLLKTYSITKNNEVAKWLYLLSLNPRGAFGVPEPVKSILQPVWERPVVLLRPAGSLLFCPSCGDPGKHSSSNQLLLLQENLKHQQSFLV